MKLLADLVNHINFRIGKIKIIMHFSIRLLGRTSSYHDNSHIIRFSLLPNQCLIGHQIHFWINIPTIRKTFAIGCLRVDQQRFLVSIILGIKIFQRTIQDKTYLFEACRNIDNMRFIYIRRAPSTGNRVISGCTKKRNIFYPFQRQYTTVVFQKYHTLSGNRTG